MKRLLLICLVFNTLMLHAQFHKIDIGTDVTLTSLSFPTPEIGYAVGDSSVIFKTTDRGWTWEDRRWNLPIDFRSVWFINAEKGFISGIDYADFKEKLFRTTDGGDTWEVALVQDSFSIRALYFVDENVGFIAGIHAFEFGRNIMKTTDGGITWELPSAQAPFNNIPRAFDFPTTEIGYAVNQGSILKTVDGGDTWFMPVDPNSPFPFSVIEAVEFIDENTGFIGGWYNGALWRTEDGGATWTDMTEGAVYALKFGSDLVGYAFSYEEGYQKTSDGGLSWEWLSFPENLVFTSRFSAAHFQAEEEGVIIGSLGTILKMGNLPTSVNIERELASSKVFPNPTKNTITWQFDQSWEAGKNVLLYNFKGEQLAKWAIEQQTSIDLKLPHYPAGIYHLKLQTASGKIYTTSFVIKP